MIPDSSLPELAVKKDTEGLYAIGGIVYLQITLDAVRRAQYALERLTTHWQSMVPSERRELFGAASSALRNAETSAHALADYTEGLDEDFTAALERARWRRVDAGNTATAKLRWLHDKKAEIERVLMGSGVIIQPRPKSAADLYTALRADVFGMSVPLFTDAEKASCFDDELKDLVDERWDEAAGYSRGEDAGKGSHEVADLDVESQGNDEDSAPEDDSSMEGTEGGDAP